MNTSHDVSNRLATEISTRARLAPEQVGPDAHFIADMGMSSLDVLCVLAFAEKTFSIKIPDDMLGELTTLNKVAEAVRTHQLEQKVIHP